jgi:ribonuclease P protein component
MAFTLKKSERIHKRDEIQKLFREGKSFNQFPFKVLHSTVDTEEESVKIAISIPKRKFKKAVDRNLLKRRTREAYRLNKEELKIETSTKNKTLILFFIYTSDKALPFVEIEHKINLILLRLRSIYGETN